MIFGFPDRPSARPGEVLRLHVSTDAPQFRVEIYRWGVAMTFVGETGWLPGTDVPHHLPWQDWSKANTDLHGGPLPSWPGHDLVVGSGWSSGIYVAVLIEGNSDGTERARPDTSTPDGRSARALFTVLPVDAPSDRTVLYKLPLLTYHAYNMVSDQRYDPDTTLGSWCLYTIPEAQQLPVAVPPSVNLRRPGGGTGGTPFDWWNVDPYDATFRQTFVHWDAPFISWLESNGYRVDFCTDLDVHADVDGALLRRYSLLLSVGHDEYWTAAMRDHVEAFVAAGGNVAFFGGNTCWGRIIFDDEVAFRRVGNWRDRPEPDRPENHLTGVSFRHGGERDGHEHPEPVGYRVQHAGHWVYDGTGLRDGDTFGDAPDEYLVGYECDGANFDRSDLVNGVAVRTLGDDGTPESFVILGVGDVGASGWGTGNRAATMGVHGTDGTVFTAATTDWSRLVAARHPLVERITRNVVDRLAQPPTGS